MSEYFIHESCIIENSVLIGNNTKIWCFTHVSSNTYIGERCVIGQNVFIGLNVRIGNGCKIHNNVSIYTSVELEDEVFCGPSTVFTNVVNPRAFIERKNEFKRTLVKKGASLGANSTIVCGNTIGRYAMIAAGSVVTKDIAEYALIAGVPGKQIGWVCKCGVTLKEFDSDGGVECIECGSKYINKGRTLIEKV